MSWGHLMLWSHAVHGLGNGAPVVALSFSEGFQIDYCTGDSFLYIFAAIFEFAYVSTDPDPHYSVV